MSCKHLNENNECQIKNKIVDNFDCNKCLLKIEDYNLNFDGLNLNDTIFGDFFNNLGKNKQ